MDIALMVIGAFAVVLILGWAYAHFNNPEMIDEEEESEVRTESPQERERARFEEKRREMEAGSEDPTLYSIGSSHESMESGAASENSSESDS